MATLNLIKGQTRQLDLLRLLQDGKDPRFGFLMFTHGLIADVDIESERFRWAGIARNTMSGVQRLVSLRRYDIKFWYLPANEHVGVVQQQQEQQQPHVERPEQVIDQQPTAEHDCPHHAAPSEHHVSPGDVHVHPSTGNIEALQEAFPPTSTLPEDPRAAGWKVLLP